MNSHDHKEGEPLDYNYITDGIFIGTNQCCKIGIAEVLKKYCRAVHLKRFDKKNDDLEASFLIDLDSFDDLEKMKDELSMLSKTINISYLDKLGFH